MQFSLIFMQLEDDFIFYVQAFLTWLHFTRNCACFAIIYNSILLSILQNNNWEYLGMFGIKLYKL